LIVLPFLWSTPMGLVAADDFRLFRHLKNEFTGKNPVPNILLWLNFTILWGQRTSYELPNNHRFLAI
jgi:hypothetical protein